MDLIVKNRQTILKWYNRKYKGFVMRPIPPHGEMSQTKYVKPSMFEPLKQYQDIFGEPILINIYPMLLPTLCHNNVEDMLVILNKNSKKYRGVLGYNVSSCPCGRLVCMELHSVLQYIETGQYIDLTTDYNNEKQKWFVPLVRISTDDIKHYSYAFTNIINCDVFSMGQAHKCGGMTWRRSIFTFDGDLSKLVRSLSTTIIPIFL
jgi:hypothetical protein